LWYVGVLLSIGASLFGNLGQNVQKLAQDKNPEKEYIHLPAWWVGLGLVCFGSIGDIVSLTFAPQSVVMPVGSFTLAANIFLANRFFGETLSRQDIEGTVLIILGATGVAVAYGVLGEVKTKCYDRHDLAELYENKLMWAYLVLVLALLVIFHKVIVKCSALRHELLDAHERHDLEAEKKAHAALESLKKIHPTAYAAKAGVLGGCSGRPCNLPPPPLLLSPLPSSFLRYSLLPSSFLCYYTRPSPPVLFAASVMALVVETGRGDNQFNSWEPYVFLIAMLTSLMLQTDSLAHGLKVQGECMVYEYSG
jgi:hypothetical protein